MDIPGYIEKRKLEMLKESQSLGMRRDQLIAQLQQGQTQLKTMTERIIALDIELNVLQGIETEVLKED